MVPSAQATPPPLPLRIGRYEVEVLLGEGQVRRLLLAHDPLLGRPVVVHVLRDDLGLPADARAQLVDRFRKAARAAASLSHPGVVALHDIGDDDRAGVYVVYELVRAPTLRERLGRRMRAAELAPISRALGAALAYAHASGVFHGDVKPENVLLALSGAKLADFAMRPALEVTPSPNVSSSSDAAARDAYRAPEVVETGLPSARADQFALAAVLYEALTGRPPHEEAIGPARTVRSRRAEHVPIARLVPELRGARQIDAIFDCALARDERRRFPSCDVFSSTLSDALEASGVVPPTPPSQGSIVPRATRRWQNMTAGAAFLVICALVVLGRQPREQSGASPQGASAKSAARAVGPGSTPPSRSPSVVSSPADRGRAAARAASFGSASPGLSSSQSPESPPPPGQAAPADAGSLSMTANDP